jgi:hypothetical protein
MAPERRALPRLSVVRHGHLELASRDNAAGGLKHVVLGRGLIDLGRDIPNSDVDLLALRNRLLVRKELHPALQYFLLEAMREVHAAPGPFNRLGEFSRTIQ